MPAGPSVNFRLSDDAVRLAGRLTAALAEDQRVVLFTGSTATRGVSTVASHVALAFAKLVQQPILLIDAKAEGPTLHTTFNVPLAPGLTEVLERRVGLDAAVSRLDANNLWFLPRGGDADYTHLLGSEACKELLQSMRQKYRLTLIDGSPILLSAPTSILASQSDGVVAVVAAGSDHKADVVELKRILDGLKVNLIGAVLTTAARQVWRGGSE